MAYDPTYMTQWEFVDDDEPGLPEQEWCTKCAPTDDPHETGMPRDIVHSHIQGPWGPRAAWGPDIEITVLTLTCGHEVRVTVEQGLLEDDLALAPVLEMHEQALAPLYARAIGL